MTNYSKVNPEELQPDEKMLEAAYKKYQLKRLVVKYRIRMILTVRFLKTQFTYSNLKKLWEKYFFLWWRKILMTLVLIALFYWMGQVMEYYS